MQLYDEALSKDLVHFSFQHAKKSIQKKAKKQTHSK
jgi:hypothetical protein